MAITDLPIGIYAYGESRKNERRAQREMERIKQLWADLPTPSLEDLQVVVQKEVSQGRLDPELSQAILADPSAMQEVGADPELVRAQQASLGALQNIARQGGLDLQSRARLAEAQGQIGQQARGQREALLAQQQRQGTLGSGQGLAAQLMAQQGAADQASRAGLQAAASADERALQALMQSGQMAGDMRGQKFSEDERRAQAMDRINRFNTQHRQQLQAANRNTINQARRYNLDKSQGLERRNVDRRTAGQLQHAGAQRTKFDIDRSKTAGQAGAHGQQANIYSNQANRYGNAAAGSFQSFGEDAEKAATGGLGAADGAVVPGQNYAGDRVDAQLNSGEMVLNVNQQQNLLDLLSGKPTSINTEEPIVQDTMVENPLEVLADMKQPQSMADGGMAIPDSIRRPNPIEELMQKILNQPPDPNLINTQTPPNTMINDNTNPPPSRLNAAVPPGHPNSEWINNRAQQKRTEANAYPVGSSTPDPNDINIAEPTASIPTGVGEGSNYVPPVYEAPMTNTMPPVDTPPTRPAASEDPTKEPGFDYISALLGAPQGSNTGQKIMSVIGGASKGLARLASPTGTLPEQAPSQYDEAAKLALYKSELEDAKYKSRRGDKLSDQERKAEEAAEKQRKLEEPPKTYKDVIDRYANTSYGKDRLQKIQNMITGYVKLEKLMSEGAIINEAWANKAKAALTSLMEPWLRINTGAQINDKEYSRLMGMAPSTLNSALHGKDTGTFKMGIIRDFMESNVLTYTHGTTTLNSFAYLYKNVPGSKFPKQSPNSAIQLTPPQAYSDKPQKNEFDGMTDDQLRAIAEGK